MINYDLTPFIISLKLSVVTTIVLFVLSFPIAYFLAYGNCRGKWLLETVFTLPLILPPTVLGFYILLALSPHFFIGKFLKDYFSIQLLFSFAGIVIASCIASIPFMLLPLKNGLESVDRTLIEASSTLGKSKFQTLLHVILPVIKPYIFSAPITTFAHTIGGFGVVLMIGGNIPGVTKVASIAIYEKVEELNYSQANLYSLLLLMISFTVLVSVNFLNRKFRNLEIRKRYDTTDG